MDLISITMHKHEITQQPKPFVLKTKIFICTISFPCAIFLPLSANHFANYAYAEEVNNSVSNPNPEK